jgi:hypothetical protein
VDADIVELVRASRILDAAELASSRGDARTASALFERACDWLRAAREALLDGDPGRALDFAARAPDDGTAQRALAALALDVRAAEKAAARLDAREQFAWSAQAWEAAGRSVDAAHAWERAGNAVRAAALFDAHGDPMRAARVLDAALRRDPKAWAAAVALGVLLARLGKDDAAIRCLQRVDKDAPARRDALAALAPTLARIGLKAASREALAEWAALGGGAAAETAAPTPTRARLFARYDVIREIASSPTARVLECIDSARGEKVAVKIFAGGAAALPDDAASRVARDIDALRRVDHPHIVPLRAFVPDGPAFVLAWMAGGTLDDLRAAGPIAPARAAEVATAVLSALGEGHRRGVVHRAVKPSNVLFDAAGSARLSDFGAAHWGDVSVTATAGVFGTLAYVSPELREGRPATAQSDIFAVGVLLCEMLAGERPSASAPARLRPSQSHRGLDASHDAVVDRLTAPAPSDRPGSASEARRIIASVRWPEDPAPRVGAAASEPNADAPGRDARITVDAGLEIDAWTGRAIERVPLSDAVLARARAWAAADDPALQTVLRVDRDTGTLWLEACRGELFVDAAEASSDVTDRR